MVKTKQRFSVINNCWFVAKTAYQASPSRPWADLLMALCGALQLVFLSVVFIRYIVDALEQGLAFENIAQFLHEGCECHPL